MYYAKRLLLIDLNPLIMTVFIGLCVLQMIESQFRQHLTETQWLDIE